MTQSGPYRTVDKSEARAQILGAIQHARTMLDSYRKAINQCAVRGWSSDLITLKHLNATFEVACNHERELLKQLAELER